jgi:hypothetical protein
VQNDNEVIGNGHVNVAVERDNDTSSSSRASSSDSCSTVDDTPPCRIEFTIDADVPCECRVHYLAATGKTTEHSLSDRRFSVSHAQHTSAAVACGVGANQHIECDELVFDETMLTSALSPPPAVSQALYPVIIEVHTLAAGRCQQTQLTLCTMSMSADGNGYVLKALKQKLIIDDVCYLLQEVYGIENKHVGTSGASVESVVAAASAHAEQQVKRRAVDATACMCTGSARGIGRSWCGGAGSRVGGKRQQRQQYGLCDMHVRIARHNHSAVSTFVSVLYMC